MINNSYLRIPKKGYNFRQGITKLGRWARPIWSTLYRKYGPLAEKNVKNVGAEAIKIGSDLLTNAIASKVKGGSINGIKSLPSTVPQHKARKRKRKYRKKIGSGKKKKGRGKIKSKSKSAIGFGRGRGKTNGRKKGRGKIKSKSKSAIGFGRGQGKTKGKTKGRGKGKVSKQGGKKRQSVFD